MSRLVFEDLSELTDRDILLLAREAGPELLGLSLQACSEELKERVMSTLKEEEREALNNHVASLGPTQLSLIERAQQDVLYTARRMGRIGEISFDPSLS